MQLLRLKFIAYYRLNSMPVNPFRRTQATARATVAVVHEGASGWLGLSGLFPVTEGAKHQFDGVWAVGAGHVLHDALHPGIAAYLLSGIDHGL